MYIYICIYIYIYIGCSEEGAVPQQHAVNNTCVCVYVFFAFARVHAYACVCTYQGRAEEEAVSKQHADNKAHRDALQRETRERRLEFERASKCEFMR